MTPKLFDFLWRTKFKNWAKNNIRKMLRLSGFAKFFGYLFYQSFIGFVLFSPGFYFLICVPAFCSFSLHSAGGTAAFKIFYILDNLSKYVIIKPKTPSHRRPICLTEKTIWQRNLNNITPTERIILLIRFCRKFRRRKDNIIKVY